MNIQFSYPEKNYASEQLKSVENYNILLDYNKF